MSYAHSIPPEIRALIAGRLESIVAGEAVRILFAVELGSRAWGVPSPDSDCDVRFVHVRTRDSYLFIDSRHDVIESPIDGGQDIGGRDLKKALQLAIKFNPVLLEWLRSPILYRADAKAMDRLAAFQRPTTYHLLHLAKSQYRKYVDGRDAVKLKKYLYVLRPVMALRRLRLCPGEAVPMVFATLRTAAELGPGVDALLDDLPVRKAKTRELGAGARLPDIDTLVEAEIDDARARLDTIEGPQADLLAEANDLFRAMVAEAG